jgi:hypothetical protein
MAKKRREQTAAQREAAARRKAFFAAGGTAKQWSMRAGAGVHGYTKTKAAQNKRACRGRVIKGEAQAA